MVAFALRICRRWASCFIAAVILLIFSAQSDQASVTVLGSVAIFQPCSTCYAKPVSVAGTSSTQLSPVPGLGLYAYITGLDCSNSGSATTTVELQNGSGGTVIWGPFTVAANGYGFITNFSTPIGGDTTLGGGMTVATAVYFLSSVSTTYLTCTINGYMAP